ncbi:NADH-quinone oxidoreductase subunit C [Pedobacter deserti]|uniref:NADH-quinone oxidoreductase subunit C n=1 Tax=Pedobacter deserti TaxID=2817382 RepID=UPI00210B8A6A|nr:NADH-quinone oxidoreductase subunit C [Pedobacter sp. SYSU D00382]
MTEITNHAIVEFLAGRFKDEVSGFSEPYGLLTFETSSKNIISVLSFLKQNSLVDFSFLTDITAVHYPEKSKALVVVYHLCSMKKRMRVRVKVALDAACPEIPSATVLWNGANWMERETYDLFGVVFTGHPDLRRILNMDDLGVHPMLKQYPLEDPNRVDKKDEYFGR